MKKSNHSDKKLNDLALEELWELFPIELTPHKINWEKWFNEERDFLINSLDRDSCKYISHIGSTAISAIWAKPIVDILIEISDDTSIKDIAKKLESIGYLCMSESMSQISLNKGYTINGFSEKVFHVHLRHMGDNDELYFRDYLNEHLDIAKDYQELKLKLWKKYEHNRDTYTDQKSDFIKKYTSLAIKQYFQRYKR